jgi:hypothetical protein
MKYYDVNPNKDAPLISLKISSDILRDLVSRSEENGNTIEREIALRLARSLERDLIMIEQDNQLAYKCFAQATNGDTPK